MEIFCCGCNTKVVARLTCGSEIYPHRPDLANLPFWRCDACYNYVGCHHKTKNRTAPMGNIATAEIRRSRIEIHRILDPLWKSGKQTRKETYSKISEHIGRKYHTAHIRSIEDARIVYAFVQTLRVE